MQTQCCKLFPTQVVCPKNTKIRVLAWEVLERHIWDNEWNLYSIKYIEQKFYTLFHISLIKTRASIVVAPRLLKPKDHPWWALLLALLWLQYIPPTTSDMYTQEHYYVSSTCHPQWITCTHEYATMTLVHATHNEWHVRMSMLLWLQYIPPTMSDIYERAWYYYSSICHPRWVTYIQEHPTMTPLHATHNEWHVRMITILWLQYMPPMTTGIYARTHHYDSSICRPQRVTYMQEHTTIMPLDMPPTMSDIYERAYHHASSAYHPRWMACT